MSSRREPREVLSDALTHFEMVGHHATADLDDQLTIDAICMRLSAGIEVLAALDQISRDAIFGSAWPQMWGMRNRIAHGYLLVDTDIVRSTVERDVATIVASIEAALTDLP